MYYNCYTVIFSNDCDTVNTPSYVTVNRVMQGTDLISESYRIQSCLDDATKFDEDIDKDTLNTELTSIRELFPEFHFVTLSVNKKIFGSSPKNLYNVASSEYRVTS